MAAAANASHCRYAGQPAISGHRLIAAVHHGCANPAAQPPDPGTGPVNRHPAAVTSLWPLPARHARSILPAAHRAPSAASLAGQSPGTARRVAAVMATMAPAENPVREYPPADPGPRQSDRRFRAAGHGYARADVQSATHRARAADRDC